VREVVAVFLRNTEGAYAVTRGNALIQLCTNLPEQVDKAVLSRINDRAYIAGATTLSDFLDQDHLWWRRHARLSPDFIDMRDPSDYTYLSAQAPLATAADIYGETLEAAQPRIREILQRVRRRHDPREQAFFAELFRQVKAELPAFTSRDVRNIQRAVDGRIMDFDFPDEWYRDSALFFAQGYDEKRRLLVELMCSNMRGLSFAEIRMQETIRYLDNAAVIAATERERGISRLTEEWSLREEAERRLAERRSRS